MRVPLQAAANALRSPSGSAFIARRRVRAGPLGRLAPRSHSCTVLTLNRYAAANSAWVMPVERRMSRTSTSGAMSGAASGLAAIWRAISASVIRSSLLQSVAANALAAALLSFFAITLHLSGIGLAQRDDSTDRAPIDKDERRTIDREYVR